MQHFVVSQFIFQTRFSTGSANILILQQSRHSCLYTHDPHAHSKMKHISIQEHFIQDFIIKCLIGVIHVSNKENIANLLTKPLHCVLHARWINMLRIDASQEGVLEHDSASYVMELDKSYPAPLHNQQYYIQAWTVRQLNVVLTVPGMSTLLTYTTVLIQSIRRSCITRGPKSTKSGKVTGHRSWRRNPQRGRENAKLCLQLNLIVSHVTYNSF